MASECTLAVIIPCFNYEQYVGRAIQSVLNQVSEGVDLIIVDDESTDASWNIISSFDVKAYRVSNRGPRKACLYAMEMTKAEFILCLDADDELQPGAIAEIRSKLDIDVAKLQFPLVCVDDYGKVLTDCYPNLSEYRERESIQREVLLSGTYQSPPTSGNVFRRDVFEVLRFCEYDRFIDGATLFIAPFLGDIVSVSKPLGLYRVHANNHSAVGRLPSAGSLRRDLDRFELRSQHLRSLLEHYGLGNDLTIYNNTYYYLSTSLNLAVVTKSHFAFSDLVKMLRALLLERRTNKWKAASLIFGIILFLSPHAIARHILSSRLGLSHNVFINFIRRF